MKKRFLVTSILMLLLTVFALSTSTYAWFSMNTQVTASGMQVIAKTDETFLLISSTNTTAGAIQTEDEISVDFAMDLASSQLYASSPCLSAEQAALLPATTGFKVGETAIETAGAQVNSEATANVVTNWYTAKAADAAHSTMKEGSARQLTTFTGYVVKKTVYLTVAAGANPAHNLSVTPTFTQRTGGSDIAACKVLVTTDDGAFVVLNSASGKTDIKGSNTAITSSTVRVVNIYIYYDGTESVVYTNNANNLKGATIGLSFDVEAKLN